MRFLPSTIAAVAALLSAVVSPSPSRATTIGLYFDDQGTTFERAQAAAEPGAAWLLALLDGEAAAGIIGAEFRLDSFPSGWFVTAVPNPAANFVLGDPIVEGTNLAFDACQGSVLPAAPVLLFTLNYFATSTLDQHVMSIVAHSMPSNPQFNCPLVVLCDPPTYTKLCVVGGRAAFNDPGFVSVAPSSWSAVKSLYQ